MKDAKEMLKIGLQDFRRRCELDFWKDEDELFWLLKVLKRLRAAPSNGTRDCEPQNVSHSDL